MSATTIPTSLRDALVRIRRRYGEGAVMRWGDRPPGKVAVIPTGALSLDRALGVGGIPCGRVTEIYGPESSGKTTLCQHILAQAQKQGGIAVFIDMEHALDSAYAARCGVHIETLVICQPDTGEQAMEITEGLVRSGAIDVVVIDSAAALVPWAEIEGEMGDYHAGLQARLIAQAMRKLTGPIATNQTALIFTTQLRQNLTDETKRELPVGGYALHHHASIRMEMRRVQAIREGKTVTGNRIRVMVKKNKVAPPFRSAEFDVMFHEGISWIRDLFDVALDVGVIQRIGSAYTYNGAASRLGYTRAEAIQNLRTHSWLAEELEALVRTEIGLAHANPVARLPAEFARRETGLLKPFTHSFAG
jgi:recombination protein RecA